VFHLGGTFFRGDMADKTPNKLPNETGYRPFGIEYSQSAARPDQVESFSICHALNDTNANYLTTRAKALYDALLRLFDALEPVAEELTVKLAEMLTGLPYAEKFRGALRRYSLLQLNYSQPASTAVDYINETHEDGSLVTLTSVTAEGLEIQTPGGSFLPITPSADELLLMSGEVLSLLTGGKIRPILHRVLPLRSVPERMSLLFFADLNPSLCRPWITNRTNANIDIGALVLKNPVRFGLSEWIVDAPN
jgi:isopenicillin N synthase-like dioxygenase